MVRARYGRIVNMTSVIGEMGNSGQASYGAAKAGIIGFTKSMARELATRNITVNAVAPGFIDTEMTAGSRPHEDEGAERHSAKRTGPPEEVAGWSRSPSSDEARTLRTRPASTAACSVGGSMSVAEKVKSSSSSSWASMRKR